MPEDTTEYQSCCEDDPPISIQYTNPKGETYLENPYYKKKDFNSSSFPSRCYYNNQPSPPPPFPKQGGGRHPSVASSVFARDQTSRLFWFLLISALVYAIHDTRNDPDDLPSKNFEANCNCPLNIISSQTPVENMPSLAAYSSWLNAYHQYYNILLQNYYSHTGIFVGAFSTDVKKPSKFLIVDKPADITSMQVCRSLKSLFRNRWKVGHGGTLDPMATGVLVLGIGTGTRYLASCLRGEKTYIATAKLGSQTSTADFTGSVIKTTDVSVPEKQLRKVISEFVKSYAQTPPMVSARWHKGERLYNLAFRGITVERKPTMVEIKTLNLLSVVKTNDHDDGVESFSFEVSCSGGTYIRVLAEDIAVACGSLAHLTKLRRTRQGIFSEKDCLKWPLTIDKVEYNMIDVPKF